MGTEARSLGLSRQLSLLKWGGVSTVALLDFLGEYLDRKAVAGIRAACEFGAAAHAGQKRESGDAYIAHPFAVARILGEMRMDSRTIIAAVLHDVVEDTAFTVEELAEKFGTDVAALVDGVSKVSLLEQESKEQSEAASFRKMFMATAKDIRVIIIKLADRLHNMRTLDALRAEKKRRVAKQTLEIYAPIANRLGMRDLAQKLENLSLQNLYPKRYDAIARKLRESKRGRKPVIDELCETISRGLQRIDIKAEVAGREKDIYSIYRKMQQKKLTLREVHDINAIRVICETRAECYPALGVIHQHFKPRPSSFKDYIAIPKVNGYQSLHTVVVGAFGQPVEVQIRSQAMHRIAENGVASHWLYKTETTGGGEHAPQQLAKQWLSSFLASQQQSIDSGEFLEHLKADLFPDEVYVFTPEGEIKRLPRGATALDFAYAVHTDVGNRAVGARINQQVVALHARLHNGDHLEIITARGYKAGEPAPEWLNFAVTAKARTSIRAFLAQQKGKESVKLGRKLLRQALAKQGYRRPISRARKAALLAHLHLEDWREVLREIGFGKRLPVLVAKQLLTEGEAGIVGGGKGKDKAVMTIEGTERLLVAYANCCHPIPGDAIIGAMTTGRGLVVHRRGCRNQRQVMRHPENCVDLAWSDATKGGFQALLRLGTRNRPGALAAVSNIIAAHNSNINRLQVTQAHAQHSSMEFVIEVTGRKHLAAIMRKLHREAAVIGMVRG